MNDNYIIDTDKIPHDKEAEQYVLGSLLVDSECMNQVVSLITADDFYDEWHQTIYKACKSLYDMQISRDQLTVARELNRKGKLTDCGGAVYLSTLIANVPTSYHVKYYAEIVKATADKRRIITLAHKISQSGYDDSKTATEIIDQTINQLLDFKSTYAESGLVPITTIANRYVAEITRWIDGQDTEQGHSTGFKGLDHIIDGLQKNKLYVIAARPSMGKTMISLNISKHLAKQGKKVAIYSLEQDKKSLLERLTFSEARINRYVIRRQEIDTKRKYWEAYKLVSELPLKINDMPSLKTDAAMAELMVEQSTNGIDVMIFDYIGIAGDEAKNEILRVGQITKNLRNIARQVHIPVIACCQLSRAVEIRENKRPMLPDLRDSGEVEQVADVVIGLYRDERYNDGKKIPVQKNTLEAIVLKNRDGDIGTELLYYDASTGFMSELRQE